MSNDNEPWRVGDPPDGRSPVEMCRPRLPSMSDEQINEARRRLMASDLDHLSKLAVSTASDQEIELLAKCVKMEWTSRGCTNHDRSSLD